MNDAEYMDTIERVLEDRRAIAVWDLPDHEGEIVIFTGIRQNDGDWLLDESATGN